jgi:hypothetical protein
MNSDDELPLLSEQTLSLPAVAAPPSRALGPESVSSVSSDAASAKGEDVIEVESADLGDLVEDNAMDDNDESHTLRESAMAKHEPTAARKRNKPSSAGRPAVLKYTAVFPKKTQARRHCLHD